PPHLQGLCELTHSTISTACHVFQAVKTHSPSNTPSSGHRSMSASSLRRNLAALCLISVVVVNHIRAAKFLPTLAYFVRHLKCPVPTSRLAWNGYQRRPSRKYYCSFPPLPRESSSGDSGRAESHINPAELPALLRKQSDSQDACVQLARLSPLHPVFRRRSRYQADPLQLLGPSPSSSAAGLPPAL